MGLFSRIIKSPVKDAGAFGKKKSNSVDPKRFRVRYPASDGFRNDTGIKFKSKMEANIFRWLRTKKIDSVEYEPELWYFRNNRYGIKAYVPDFKITDGKRVWYIEVKGFHEKQDSQKAWLVSTQYPWCRIYYIYPKQYNLIKKYYAKQVANWEW